MTRAAPRQLVPLLLLALALLADPLQLPAQEARPNGFQQGVLIRFEGPIFSLTEQVLVRQLERAREMGADLVVIEIDSPGGEVEASFHCAELLEGVNFATTVAWVPKMALSGAAIMALGCDQIVMHPQARLGDAGPIYANDYGMFEHAPEKVRTDLSTRIRSLAERNGRPAALAQAMVDNTLEVFRVKHADSGDERFLTDNELQAMPDAAQWVKQEQVFKPNDKDFLEVTGQQAVSMSLADMNAEDRRQLADQLDYSGSWQELRRTWVDTTVFILNAPLVTGLLFLVGMIALFVEFSAPGISIGGLISALSFTLFFWSRFLGGTAGWLEVVLFLMGILFLMMEFFVIPGFGVAGLSGILLIIASLVMASQTFLLPGNAAEWQTTRRSFYVVFGAGAGFMALAIVLTRYLGGIPILSRLTLTPPTASESDLHVAGLTADHGQVTGLAAIEVGAKGAAETPLRPSGKALFDGELIDVITEGDFVDVGEPVQVRLVEGNRIVVRKLQG